MKNKPHYFIIFNHIVQQIYMGKIKIGDQLDSIKIMAETYAVSENTIRNVIEMLAERGFISTKSGKNSMLVSNSGNLKQSLEYFLARKKQFFYAHEIFKLLFPSIAAFGINYFDENDCKELTEIVEKMGADVNNDFVFREQKMLFLQKIISKCGNSLMHQVCISVMEAVMLPHIASDIVGKMESILYSARIHYFKSAQFICCCVKEGNIQQAKKELTELYEWIEKFFFPKIVKIMDSYQYLKSEFDEECYILQTFYLYDEIVSDIIDKIYEGNYQIGDYLPSVITMTKKYKVSVPTVRTAYSILNKQGIAKTMNGKGTKIILYSEYSVDYGKTLAGIIRLSKFWEAFQLLTVTVKDIIFYADKRISYKDIQKIETYLCQIWQSESTDIIQSIYILLDKMINYINNEILKEIYCFLKKELIFVYYIKRFCRKDYKISKTTYLQCLKAIEKMKAGNREEFSILISLIFYELLQCIQNILMKFGWSFQ